MFSSAMFLPSVLVWLMVHPMHVYTQSGDDASGDEVNNLACVDISLCEIELPSIDVVQCIDLNNPSGVVCSSATESGGCAEGLRNICDPDACIPVESCTLDLTPFNERAECAQRQANEVVCTSTMEGACPQGMELLCTQSPTSILSAPPTTQENCIPRKNCVYSIALPGHTDDCYDNGVCSPAVAGECTSNAVLLCPLPASDSPTTSLPTNIPTSTPTPICESSENCIVDKSGLQQATCVDVQSGICTAYLPMSRDCPLNTRPLCLPTCIYFQQDSCDFDFAAPNIVNCVHNVSNVIICEEYVSNSLVCADGSREVCPASESPTYAPITLTPTTFPSHAPTFSQPSSSPSVNPTAFPTALPTQSVAPSELPSRSPSYKPTFLPSVSPPTTSPSELPTLLPTISLPTNSPSSAPTRHPTNSPSSAPTRHPSESPTTQSPSAFPSEFPTSSTPTEIPSIPPSTTYPSLLPTISQPTIAPSTSDPTSTPSTLTPTAMPSTRSPTFSPSVSGAVQTITLWRLSRRRRVIQEPTSCITLLSEHPILLQFTFTDLTVQFTLVGELLHIRFKPLSGVTTFDDVSLILNALGSSNSCDFEGDQFDTSSAEAKVPGTLAPTLTAPTTFPTLSPTTPSTAPSTSPTRSRSAALLSCDVCTAPDVVGALVSSFYSRFAVSVDIVAVSQAEFKIRILPGDATERQMHGFAESIDENPLEASVVSCGVIICTSLELLPGDPLTISPSPAPTEASPSVAPTVPCDRQTLETSGCQHLIDYCCVSDILAQLCPVTCCGQCYVPPPIEFSGQQNRASGTSITGPMYFSKGRGKIGTFNVEVQYWTGSTSRVDLVPYLTSATGYILSGVLLPHHMESDRLLSNLNGVPNQNSSSTVIAKLYIGADTPDGTYQLRFAIKDAGSPFTSRFNGTLHSEDIHEVSIRNEYVLFDENQLVFAVPPVPTDSAVILPVALRYWSATPVRFSARLYCQSSVCGDKSSRNMYVLNNRNRNRLAAPVPFDLSEGHVSFNVRIGPGIFTSNWTLFHMHIAMGTYTESGKGTLYGETIDTTSEPAIVAIGAGAALGNSHSLGNSSVVTDTHRDSLRDKSINIVLFALGIIAVVVLIGAAFARHRKLRLDATQPNGDSIFIQSGSNHIYPEKPLVVFNRNCERKRPASSDHCKSSEPDV